MRKGTFFVLTGSLLLGAFVVGASGLPGDAVVAAIEWMVSQGYVVLEGPAGEVVKGALL